MTFDHGEVRGYLLGHHALAVPGVATLGKVVDSSKLDEGREDKGIADSDKPIHGGCIGHLGEGVPGTDTKRGHGQHGGHSCRKRRHRRSNDHRTSKGHHINYYDNNNDISFF